MTAQESKETGQRLFKSRQYAEAIPLLKSAAEIFPKDETLWQELVMSCRDTGQHEQAVEYAKQAVRQLPRSDWLWRHLGDELTVLDRLEEAEKALNNSENLKSDAPWLWRYWASLHQKRKAYDKEIQAREKLLALEEPDGGELNRLGIAYYNLGRYVKAVEFYRLSAAKSPDTSPFYNMGLAFSHSELSQDVDAADAYRRALALNPKYDKAQERLEETKKKLLPLAERARGEANGLIRPEDFFQFYINPFEIFPIEFDGELAELDPKTIQRAKKRLLSEIDLNDGRVEWLENQEVDRARALALEDDLYDKEKRRFHWSVFENKQLLRFLTRGDVEHFLYSEDYFPQTLLKHLDEEPEFRNFLTKPFARQYNLLLTRAIERQASAVVEVLFDGRRWVEQVDEDICFEGASKRVNDFVAQICAIAEQGKKQKVDLNQIRNLLSQKGVVEMFNLLPTSFRTAQSKLVSHLRSLAIDCHNEHSDSELSAQILGLCKNFRFKSADLNKQLEDDSKAIDKILAENRKHTFSMWIRQNQAAYISQNGIKYVGEEVSASDVESIRWGIYVRTVNGVESEHSFSLVVRGSQTQVSVEWGKRGIISGVRSLFRKKVEAVPVVEMSSADQDVYFRKMIDAAIHYLIPPLVSKLAQRLRGGVSLGIGPCMLTQTGVAFRTGLIFRKDRLVAWHDAETQMQNGQIVIFSKSNRGNTISMSAKDTDNGVILPILCAAMRDESN